MGAPPTLPRPTAGRARADVLVSGVERAPWTPSPRAQGAAAVGLLLAATLAVTAALVQAQRAQDARDLALREADRGPRLELRTGEQLVRRDRGGPPGGPAHARVDVEVVNRSPRTLRVVSAALTPGRWSAEVVGADVVAPGGRLVLALTRTVDCGAPDAAGPAPTQLVLTALLPDQSPRAVAVDVAHEQPAYAGRLDDALRDPHRACRPAP